MYPDKLRQAIVNGMLRQKEVDESNQVSTGKMNEGQCLSVRAWRFVWNALEQQVAIAARS